MFGIFSGAQASLIPSSAVSGAISARQSNSYGVSSSFFAPGTMEAGSQRSYNGEADASNQRASRTFLEFTLTADLILAASGSMAEASLSGWITDIANEGGLYTNGLDLRYLGISATPLTPTTLWNTSGVGGADQADIVATTATPGAFSVVLTNPLLLAQIQAAQPNDRLYFGLSNSSGVDTSAPVPLSTQPENRHLFILSSDAADYSLTVVPEPASLLLVLMGGLALFRLRPRAR